MNHPVNAHDEAPGEHHRHLSEILEQALKLLEGDRAAYLDRACGGDTSLRAEVERSIQGSPLPTLTMEAAALTAQGTDTGTLSIGRRIAHYEITGKLGEGGMGAVYKAVDVNLGRQVALKVISRTFVSGDDKRRFAREAKAASALNHPNIVTIYEYNSEDGVDFIAMELVEGVTLAHVLAQRKAGKAISVETLVSYSRQVASALAKTHAAGIGHRDLKPGNIMVTPEGLAKVLDFGLARREPVPGAEAEGVTVALTQVGAVIGTPAYMSPEQAMGEQVDARSDVFSFGIILYECLYGRRPFSGDSTQATLRQIALKEPDFHPEGDTFVSCELSALVRQCLTKEKDQRLISMAQAVEILAGGPIAVMAPASMVTVAEAGNIAVRPRRRGPRRLGTAVAWTAMALALALAVPMVRQRFSSGRQVVLPISSQDWVAEGQAYLARYDKKDYPEKAMEAFRKAAELDQQNAAAYTGLADAYLSRLTNNTADPQWTRLALDAAKRATEINPYLSAAHASLGYAYASLGNLAEANPSLDRALTLDPKNFQAYLYRAIVYEKQNDAVNAEQSYRRAASLASNDWRVFNRLGAFLYRGGRLQEAIEAFETANRLAAENSGVNSNLGAAYHAVGREEDAAAAFQRSLAVNPTARGFSNLGTLLYYLGRYRDASEAFARAVELDAQSQLRWGNLGDAYRWTPGNQGKSVNAYRRAIQLAQGELAKSPADADLIASLAGYLAKSGNTAEALTTASTVKIEGLKKASVWFKLAVTYEVCQDRAKALNALEKAMDAGYSVKDVQNEPEFLALRKDAGYARIMSRLPEEPRK